MAAVPNQTLTGQRLSCSFFTGAEYYQKIGPILDLAGAPINLSAWASFRLVATVQGPGPSATIQAIDIATPTGDAAGFVTVKNTDLLTGLDAGNFGDSNFQSYQFEISAVHVALDPPQSLATGTLTTNAFKTQ